MVKISVIMPVYNKHPVNQSINSFLNQNLDNIELVCICDEDISKKHDFIKVCPSNNNNPENLRKNAVNMACGDYICFLDEGDCFQDNNSLDKLYELISKNDAEMACFSFSDDFDKYLLNSSFPLFNSIYKKEFIMNNGFALDFKNETDKILFNLEMIFKAEKLLFYKYDGLIDFESGEVDIPELFCGVKEILIENDCHDRYIDEFNLFKIMQGQIYLDKTNYDFIRREFIYMDIDSDLIKEISFDLYKFYFHILNNQNKDVFDVYTYKVKKVLNYIVKYEIDEKIANFNDMGINPDDDNQLIVSLTSFPERMHDIHYCLYSLLTQSLKPNKIILWLAESQFPNHELDLPDTVLKLKNNGLTIKWCEDLKSYKKLIPVLKEYPNSYIVTTDDDVYYPDFFLENIWNESQKHPNCIIASRARWIKLVNNEIADYWEWEMVEEGGGPSYTILATGSGGILYPPDIFPNLVFNRDLYEKLCPSGDDLWFWAMAVLNEIKIVNTQINLNFLKSVNIAREIGILDIDTTLWHHNKTNHNNIQLQNLINHFPEILERITEE